MSFSSSKIVKKSRKEFRCFLCAFPIPVGSKYIGVAGTFEGHFFSSAQHDACEKVYRLNYDALDGGDGISEGVIQDAWTAEEIATKYREAGVWGEAIAWLGDLEDDHGTTLREMEAARGRDEAVSSEASEDRRAEEPHR